MEKYTCKICSRKFQTIRIHTRRVHAMSIEEYFEQYPEELDIYTDYRERVVYPLLQERSPNNLKFYLTKGMSEEDAEKALLEHRAKSPFKLPENRKCNMEYWLARGFTEEEAIEQKRLFNSHSLTECITKYGEAEGALRYQKWINKLLQRPENELLRLEQMTGSREEAIFIRTQRYKDSSPRCLNYWTERGYDEQTARELISEYQSHGYKRHIEKWMKQGFSLDEAKLKAKESTDMCSIDGVLRRYNCSLEEAIEYQREIVDKRLNTCIERGLSIPLEARSEAEQYYFSVWRETQINWRVYRAIINPLNLPRGKIYHLDHKYSIMQGFLTGIDARIIASVPNLEIITSTENCSKQNKCSISLKHLLEEYSKFTQLTNRIVYV